MTRERLAAQLRREDGMALVLTMVLMTVMAIMMSSMLAYTSASARDSYLKQSEQSAHSLAEGAINQGTAQLASHYYDSPTRPTTLPPPFHRRGSPAPPPPSSRPPRPLPARPGRRA